MNMLLEAVSKNRSTMHWDPTAELGAQTCSVKWLPTMHVHFSFERLIRWTSAVRDQMHTDSHRSFFERSAGLISPIWLVSLNTIQQANLPINWKSWSKQTSRSLWPKRNRVWSGTVWSIQRSLNIFDRDPGRLRLFLSLMDLADLLNETCWKIHHVSPPLLQRSSWRCQRTTQPWAWCRSFPRCIQRRLSFTQRSKRNSTLISVPSCEGFQRSRSSIHRLNSRSINNRRDHRGDPLCARIMLLNGESLRIHQSLLLVKERGLCDQVQVAWVTLHSHRRDPRTCVLFTIGFNWSCAVSMDAC